MVVWSALKEALRADEGYAFLRYPVFPADGDASYRYEPDILLLHRQLGLVVIEVKDCRADNVVALEGQTWRMRDWRAPTEAPYAQAQRQMWALLKHFKPRVGSRVRGIALVALPFAPSDAWEAAGHSALPCNPGILHQDQLTPAKLRKRLYALTRGDTQPLMDDDTWSQALHLMGLRPVMEQLAQRPTVSNWRESLARIRNSEEAIPKLDLEQLRIGLEIPPGPQRIRGIAGSGKTLLLAMKAARMHLSHPDWDIAFTFQTKSLYQVVREHIGRFCRHFGDRDPDWNKLRVLHAWGGKNEPGLYSELAARAGHPARDLNWARANHAKSGAADAFSRCCEDLLESGLVRPTFDAILVDEGQDFLPSFYQLARAGLRPPHRLIWAYDEAQSLDHLTIPDAETLFGRDERGQLCVDLSGQYPGGIWKSRIMRKCYRTPSQILVPAHAFGMGLLRPQGPVQLITTQAGWGDIGYQVESGSFEAAGREVVLTRPADNSPHPLEQYPDEKLIQRYPAESRAAELASCVLRMKRLLEFGVSPDDVLIVALAANKDDVADLGDQLRSAGIPIHVAGQANASVFRSPGAVTISGINRAKGNEAPFVFVLCLDKLARKEGNVETRNQLFVALTRSRAVCMVSGVVPEAATLFAELERVVESKNRLVFRTPDPKALRRQLSQEPEAHRILKYVKHVPLYDIPVAAGPWQPARNPDLDDADWIDASILGKLDEGMFALRVRGDSMAPRIPDGAIAVFQKYEGVPPVGRVVLASVSEDQVTGASLVVKRLAQEGDALVLRSENTKYPPIAVPREEDGAFRFVGVLKGMLERS